MKFTRRHANVLDQYIEKMDARGCVTVDQWTSGSGRYTSNRTLPPFVYRFERQEYPRTALPRHGTCERTAYEFFRRPENARRRAVLVLDIEDMRRFLYGNSYGKEM